MDGKVIGWMVSLSSDEGRGSVDPLQQIIRVDHYLGYLRNLLYFVL